MKIESLQITDEIKIIKPKANDLELEYPLESTLMGGTWFSQEFPSSIIEMSCKAKDNLEVDTKVKKISAVLQLYNVGSVEWVKIIYKSESILEDEDMGFSYAYSVNYHIYELIEKDKYRLIDFFSRIEPLISQEIIQIDSEKVDHISIAYQRYKHALTRPYIIEGRLTSAIMSLEALYLKESEIMELSYRLAQRVALVVGMIKGQTLDVYNKIKKAYEIRSRFVHGSKIKEKDKRDIKTLLNGILEYTRISIVLFLQLKIKIRKDDLLDLISDASLDEYSKSELKNKIEEYCNIFENNKE